MSGRGVSSRRAIEQMATEGDQAQGRERPQESAQETAQDPEVATETQVAEERGAERLRARLREMLEDRRRVVRLGEQQIEVVEVSAIADVLAEGSEEGGS